MFTKDSLIFIVDDDIPYGKLVEMHLRRQGFRNVTFFDDEGICLQNLIYNPHVLITDYHLKYMSGLKLIVQAKIIVRRLYAILLSGAYHKELYSDDISIRDIDKYIIKGENDRTQLTEILNDFLCQISNYRFI